MIKNMYIPEKIHIETISGCNARCIMCPNSTGDYLVRKMSTKIFEKIIKEIAAVSSRPSIKLSLNGEPLLDENIIKKIQFVKKVKNLRVSLNSNASLLNKKNSLGLINSGLDRINFHVSGFSPETYGQVMKGLNFDKSVGNILNFLELARSSVSNIIIAVKYVVLKENARELKTAERFWSSKGVLFRPDILDGRAGSLGRYDKMKLNDRTGEENRPCPLIFKQMYIKHNGDVVSCWSDWHSERVFGNCKYSALLEIYNSDDFNRLRRLHAKKNKGSSIVCSKCSWVDKENL